MSSTLIFVGLPEDSKSSITKLASPVPSGSVCETLVSQVENQSTAADSASIGVPNAPKSCIAEIFNGGDTMDGGSPMKNGSTRPRVVRDTPTRPRDTHTRLFGQMKTAGNSSVSPMITDTIRSHIQFGDGEMNGSPAHSPKMNGSASSTPSRVSYTPPKRNPVTGDGVPLPTPRRRHPAASLREGNPITGDGYKSLNGQINTVTSLNGNSCSILHNRVPPGGYSSGLW
ncbi:microtubule-associated protein Jupiter isoform X2 [Maniola hyperantus]|uniref:microtubule-associated protein Jupiter isoform X2 n=1 Tax=Aphantopus hyperantus TaxID=2795564 RepID=UPI0015698E28|nr:microtubule-associated protein Jupiter isoform X2 [Maniola hyperantus]